MSGYRISRNFEASIIDHLTDELSESCGWSNVTVTKDYKEIYGFPIKVNNQQAFIGVQVTTTRNNKAQIGSDSTYRTAQVVLDIFATSDGQRLDLKDWVISIVKHGFPYYEYTLNGATKTKTDHIRVLKIDDAPINLNTDKSVLEVVDRYRHRIALEVTTMRIEP